MKRMVKHITTSSFMLLLLLKMLALPMILFEYSINKTVIEARFCENKEKPQLQCRGKCHLKKQMAKASESPESQDNKDSAKSLGIEICQEAECFSVDKQFVTLPSIPFAVTDEATIAGFCNGIFHPPAALV